MNDYTEVRIEFSPCSETITDTAAALLAEAGFESFVPDERGMTAYIPKSSYKPALRDCLEALPWTDISFSWSAIEIEGQDWNHEWEKNYFKPIIVGDRCVIHSSFHTDIPVCEYDIVIDPKMAFGTGHHSTTSLILNRLLQMDMTGKKVIDMGTGTGILSILAAMRGASEVTGVEIDEPAWENAVDNCRLNGVENIVMIHGDASSLASIPYMADVFLANINRNVITHDIASYCASMAAGATILLSGFYEQDVKIVRDAAESTGLSYIGYTTMNDWACVELRK